MKTNFRIPLMAGVVLSAALQAPAQSTNNQSGWTSGPYHLGHLEKASTLAGMDIVDAQDHKLGKIKDLAVDLANGRILEVIVATGGTLGMDEKLMAVPPSQFTYDTSQKAVELNVDKDRFAAAPTFKMENWEDTVRDPDVTGIYQYYGVKPYFTAERAMAPNVTNRFGEVQRSSQVIGKAVGNLQDEKLGKVENLIVDLPAGRVVEVIVASGGFLVMRDELSAIPPQSFQRETKENRLILDTTKENMTRAPHFNAAEWSEANDAGRVSSVYSAYHVEPYFSTNAADNTAQNVRDRDTNMVTPMDQGSSQADMDMTRQIRRQIMATTNLSMDARNVKIVTVDGKITLRGPVKSDDEKQKIAEIAANAASGSAANVNDQLQVEGTPTDSAK